MTRPLAEVEKETILVAIVNHGGIKPAARALGIHVRTIHRRLRVYGLSAANVKQIIAEIQSLKPIEQ